MNEALENINKILSKLDEVITEYNDEPTANSQFEKERSNYPDKARINEPFSFGLINLRAGREQLSGLPYLFQNNNIFASAVVARAVLESSSLALWFLSPEISEIERVKRGLIQLCEGKAYARKIYRDGERTADVDKVDKFFNDLPNMLAKLGIEFRNKKGAIVEPQQIKPKIRDLIGKKFQFSYQMLSMIAHGQPLGLVVAGYDVEKALAGNGLKEVEYKPNQTMAMLVLFTAVDSYRRALESYFIISNWDFTKIKPSFNTFRASLSTAYINSQA